MVQTKEPTFLVLGHSSEKYQPYEKRPLLPDGYTLLLSTECDRATMSENVSEVIKLASEPSLDFTKFRVYKEGEHYPELSLLLLDDHDISQGYSAISRSGVYSVPLQEDFYSHFEWTERYWKYNEEKERATYWSPHVKVAWDLSKNDIDFFSFLKRTTITSIEDPQLDYIEIQFENAVYPPPKEIKKIFSTVKSFPEVKSALRITLRELFKKLGPGTYIIPLCRSMSVDYGEAHDDLFDYIEKEIYPNLRERLSLKKNRNRTKYREQKYNLLTSLKNHEKLQEEPWKTMLFDVRANLRKSINVVKNTRSKSALKHRGENTRKQRRKSESK